MKELKKVTWYSKILTLIAMFVFIGVGFLLGVVYESEWSQDGTSVHTRT